MSSKKGIFKHGDRDTHAVLNELAQLDRKKVVEQLNSDTISSKDKNEATEGNNFHQGETVWKN